MPNREIEDADGVRWTCAQAYAGLEQESADPGAAKVEGEERYRVVCTPSGGSGSVELELARGWEESCPDEALLELIRKQRV
jgi:hypothetical protein